MQTQSSKSQWDNLPLYVVLKIGQHLTNLSGDVSSMRATCSQWREAVASVDANLCPLGPRWHYEAFPRIASIDCDARGHGPALEDDELQSLCSAAPNVRDLNLSWVYRVKCFSPLTGLSCLARLVLDGSPISDSQLASVLPSIKSLEIISLRGCSCLIGSFFSSLSENSRLWQLDVSDCALPLRIRPEIRAALASLTFLEVLDLGGNAVNDEVVEDIAKLPALCGLGLRDAHGMTDAGLEALTQGSAGRKLETLDLEGCEGLTIECWQMMTRLTALHDLSLARTPQLLESGTMPEGAASALWSWPKLRRLSLAGSKIHMSKFKLLATMCGRELTELDLSCRPEGDSAHNARRYMARMPQPQLRDLVEASRSLKQLRVLRCCGTGMPLEGAVAMLRAAPFLEVLDLSGCSLTRRDEYLTRVSYRYVSSSGLSVPPGNELRPDRFYLGDCVRPGDMERSQVEPSEFAAALGALTSLRILRLDDCGLMDDHLQHIHTLSRLEELSIAWNKWCLAQERTAMLLASALPGKTLHYLDVSGSGLNTDGVIHLASAGFQVLRTLKLGKLATNGTALLSEALLWFGISPSGCKTPAKRATVTLRELDLSECALMSRATLATVVDCYPGLTSLRLAGYMGSNNIGPDALVRLTGLRALDLTRCRGAVTDELVALLCAELTQLTQLQLGGSCSISREGLAPLWKAPCLMDVDLTCCTVEGGVQIDMDKLVDINATVHLPPGGRAPTGSPLRRERPSFRTGGPLRVDS